MKKIFSGLLILFFLQSYSQQINYAEYYIDNAVPVGSGVPISISNVDSVNLPITIPTVGVSVGFHNLIIRVRYNTGVWGMFESRSFYVKPNNDKLESSKISKAEFYFDSDSLGVGKNSNVSTGSLADSININYNVNTINLNQGFHTINVRTQDSAGVWGMFESRTFYVKSTVDKLTSAKISKAEYYFDSDSLGVGKRFSLNTGNLADSVNVNSLINSNGLSSGFHTINVRTQDSAGIWGMFESRAFYINNSTSIKSSPKLVSAEYFYNADPGLGNGIKITPNFSIADSINITANTITTGLVSGIDTLYVRVQDSLGVWSMPISKTFRICATAPNAPILNGNSIINVCNGGNASFSATPANGATIFWRGPNGFTALTNTINLANITSTKTGTYYAYSVTGATACDTSSATIVNVNIVAPPISQGLNIIGSTNVCANDSVILQIPFQTGFKYRWLKNGNNTTNNTDTLNTYTVKTSGTYNVRVTNEVGCFALMRDTIITVNPKPITSVIAGTANVLVNSTQNYSVVNTSGSNYSWVATNGAINSGNGTNTISVTWSNTPMSGSLKVIETTIKGCKGDTQTIIVNISDVSLIVNPIVLSYPSNTSSKKVGITSNTNWSVNANQTWVTLNKLNGTENDSITITLQANTTNLQRNAIVTFTAGNITQTVNITQDSASTAIDQLSLNKDSIITGSAALNTSVLLQSNRTWVVNNPVSWVTISPMSGSNNANLNVSINANNSGSSRTANVLITAGTVIRTLKIKQDASIGLKDINTVNNLIIYPNPSTGLLNIGSTQVLEILEIFDITGKLVYHQNDINQSELTINLSTLNNGIYFINLQAENCGIIKNKFVINR